MDLVRSADSDFKRTLIELIGLHQYVVPAVILLNRITATAYSCLIHAKSIPKYDSYMQFEVSRDIVRILLG